MHGSLWGVSKRDHILSVNLPALPDYAGPRGPYAASALRATTGSRINPYARKRYMEMGDKLRGSASPAITCAHPALPLWLDYFKSLDPDWHCTQPDLDQWPFSRVIPRAIPGPKGAPWPLPVGTYWIDYESLTTSKTRLPTTEWSHDIRSQFPKGSQLILGPIGMHANRIAMWGLREELLRSSLVRQFDAIVVPDMSSYINDPKPQAMIGERMTQEYCSLADDLGLPIIPIISWQSREALRRQADMLGTLVDAGRVNTVYIELLARNVDREDWFFTRMGDIKECLAHLPVRFIFSGTESGWKIDWLREIFPNGNFHITSIQWYKRTITEPGLIEQKAKHFRKQLLVFEDFINGINLPARKPWPGSVTAGVPDPDPLPQLGPGQDAQQLQQGSPPDDHPNS